MLEGYVYLYGILHVILIPDANHCLKHLHQKIKLKIIKLKFNPLRLQNHFVKKNVLELILFHNVVFWFFFGACVNYQEFRGK